MHIAIAGAGIGGLAAAILLARDGHRVEIFDQFDAPAPVGSGLMLQETGLAVLDALGLREAAETRGAMISRLFGRSVPSGRTVLDVRFSALHDNLCAIGIQRSALFDLLHETALGEGVGFSGNIEIAAASPSDGSFTDA